MSKLLIIDGNAILHRAYHAYPPLTNPKGDVINAVYGFFSMLLTILQDQQPEYLVICFDRGKPTVRQTMFAGYHAHRPQISDDFISQIKIVDDIVAKMRAAVFAMEGFEADDLIGTIATEVRREKSEERNDVEVIIVTGDRDLLQLVNSHVKVLMPLNGLTKTALFDEAAVEAKYGVHPRQFIDYKALIGDASDGYPGVTGIGPKSAAKLLQEFGTFENLYQRVNELPVKTGIKLATDAEQAALAKQLATIMTDVPLQFDIKKARCTNFDVKALREAFQEQGFTSLLSRLDVMFGSAKPGTVQNPAKQKLEEEVVEEKKTSDQLELL